MSAVTPNRFAMSGSAPWARRDRGGVGYQDSAATMIVTSLLGGSVRADGCAHANVESKTALAHETTEALRPRVTKVSKPGMSVAFIVRVQSLRFGSASSS